MATPTILTSGDTGAPVLSGEDGAMRAVMKWAMPLLGWTEEFDDAANETVAFRNSPTSGSGFYIRVADAAAAKDVINAQGAEISAFTSMTDIDTGVGQTPLQNGTNEYSYLYKSTNTSATAREYRFIGTDRSFILLVGLEDTGLSASSAFHFVGDFKAKDPLDDFFGLLCPSDEPTIMDSVPNIYTYSSSLGENHIRVLISSDGLTTNMQGRAIAPYPLSSVSNYAPGNEQPLVDDITGDSYVSFMWIKDTASNGPRGRVPGIFVPCGDWESREGTTAKTITSVGTPLGVKDLEYTVWRERSNSTVSQAYILLDEAGDWDE